MNDVVIQVENLSKQYRLGEVSTGSLGHDLNRWWHRIRGKEDPYLSITGENIRTRRKEPNAEKLKSEKAEIISKDREKEKPARSAFQRFSFSDFSGKHSAISAFQRFSFSDFSSDYVWALRDINFEVRRGEVLGIIGRNGAGKSTLLKILSRITAPTTGEIRVNGRIASLLEVGTGFHPDLTGRENIFLNGAILGMTKREIQGKLDEIVDFSGCAAYLDTPVKRYSSGMVVRLGFAVAAHLEPEILIVDEVLAVGDAEFQKKCIGKMQDVASHGRTVLFVSHNMGAVDSLCTRALCISNGQLVDQGDVGEVIARYTETMFTIARSVAVSEIKREIGDGRAWIQKLDVCDGDGVSKNVFRVGEKLKIKLAVQCWDRLNAPMLAVGINNHMGQRILTLRSDLDGECRLEMAEGCLVGVTASLDELVLMPGRYSMQVALRDGHRVPDGVGQVGCFEVLESDYFGTGHFPGHYQGVFVCRCNWRQDGLA